MTTDILEFLRSKINELEHKIMLCKQKLIVLSKKSTHLQSTYSDNKGFWAPEYVTEGIALEKELKCLEQEKQKLEQAYKREISEGK